MKAKKATEAYKSYVEKYATAKSEFEQKMAETAQVLKPDAVLSLYRLTAPCKGGPGCITFLLKRFNKRFSVQDELKNTAKKR